MKRKYILAIILFICTTISAQDVETGNDIKINIDELEIPDGFLLDMKSVLLAPPTLSVPAMDLSSYYKEKKINESLFYKINTKYGQESFYTSVGGLYSYGMGNIITLNSSSFKLNNGMKITTYGQYDADGYKKRDPSALPWQRNNFNGAFEMKTKNGNFGVRVEVQRGRDTPY